MCASKAKGFYDRVPVGLFALVFALQTQLYREIKGLATAIKSENKFY